MNQQEVDCLFELFKGEYEIKTVRDVIPKLMQSTVSAMVKNKTIFLKHIDNTSKTFATVIHEIMHEFRYNYDEDVRKWVDTPIDQYIETHGRKLFNTMTLQEERLAYYFQFAFCSEFSLTDKQLIRKINKSTQIYIDDDVENYTYNIPMLHEMLQDTFRPFKIL